MSLFKTRDWWSRSVGEEEEFDQGCLCLGNIDNDTNGLDKIIIGSFQGILRIYNPNPSNANSVEDVILEHAFKQPILQLEVGKFSSASESQKLAILHPRKLAVFNVSVLSGTVEHGSQYQLSLLYEHNLQRTAFNFCYGPFGGVKGKDFICVQSMDGTVSIFEQESFAFTRFLPGALLPGPIRYMPRLDSFVTATSSWKVEAYRYQVLAVASETAGREETQNIKSGKKIAVDWSFNIGEQALDLVYVDYPPAQPFIIVLGEHTVFHLTDNGMLKTAKKLEYDPSCVLPYASLRENKVNYLVGAHTKSLLVYEDTTLKWMAKTEFVPVQLRIGNFSGLKAGIVGLSDSGHLEVMYLGTDPSVFTPPQVEAREINFAAMEAEMAKLMKHVKAKSTNSDPTSWLLDDMITPSVKPEDDLSIYVHVNPNLDEVSMASGMDYQDEDGVPSTTVRIQMKSRLPLENVKLEITCPWPLGCTQSEFMIQRIDPGSPSETFVAVFQRYKGLPSHLYVHISGTFTSAAGGRCVIVTKANLPTKLFLKPVFPVKNAVHKITIDTNRPPVNLNDIFPDMLGQNEGGQGSALGFQFLGGGPVVSLLASKTSQRYRLQSDQLEAIWLPLRELVGRLNNHLKKGQGDFRVSFDGALPLQEYFELIDFHFDLRQSNLQYRELLSQRAAQFRTIQKRLLTRFKDKTPAPLQNLDTLLEGTYRQILALADAVEENSQAERLAANNLSSATYLLNILLKLWLDMSDEEFKVLEATLSPIVSSSEDQGWEETVDASITHLLRTVMAKSAKDQAVNPSPLTPPEDTSKLKKHIALFCDRLGKGARLVEGLKENKEKVVKKHSSSSLVEQSEIIEDKTPVDEMLKGKHKSGQKKKRDKTLGLPQRDQPFSENSLLMKEEDDYKAKSRLKSLVPDLDVLTKDMDDMDDNSSRTNDEDDSHEIVYSL
uniref:PTHB1 N-terminal domain-containing protein n=1 Tax=Biomphalaria glabrata TaxID=6526 RepID=A0A2C9K7V7_BIOGL